MSAPRWQVELRGRIGELEIDLSFETDAAATLVVGPNGAGKTTLLRAIAGGATGLRGVVKLGEHTLMNTDEDVHLAPEDRKIGYVPQGYGLFPHLSALDNVAFGCPRGPAGREQARAMLERLDVVHLAERRPRALSGGESQRIALARALVLEPAGLLLDEPLAALDVGKRRAVRSFLAKRLHEASCPALVVTHDLRDVVALGGDVLVLEAGRVIQRGPAEALAKAPASDFVAELFEQARPLDSTMRP